MRHSWNFDKIESFLKPVFKTFILHNLIIGWEQDVAKRGLVFCIKSIDLGEVFEDNLIHQNKTWYYLGPFQISKVKPLLFFAISRNSS